MKLGLMPYFDANSVGNGEWVIGFAQLAEQSGCESIWVPEHVVVAEGYEPLYPYAADGQMPVVADAPFPDPLEWLSFAAAVTREVRLGTAVLIVPQHSAVTLAKRVATLDALSGGRAVLGVGIGWQKEEYAAIGAPYAQRGARLDESIAALRTLWSDHPATFEGRFVAFERVHCEPRPKQAHGVPIVIGGSSEAAARRAGRLGDGFYPYVISPEELRQRVADMRAAALEVGRDPDAIEVCVWPASWKPDGTFDLDLAKRYADAGVSRFMLSAMEGGGSGLDDVRRLVDAYQARVLTRL